MSQITSRKIKNIIWDWNGTILDDVDANLAVINKMLARRCLDTLSIEQYKKEFCFPVINFYKKIGFSLERESIQNISIEYHKEYRENKDLRLFSEVRNVLNILHIRGLNNYILSSSEEYILKKQVEDFKLNHIFQAIYGTNKITAEGKVSQGLDLLKYNQLLTEETILIGDTIHDAEVANQLDLRCILYANGHCHKDVLIKTKYPIIQNLNSIIDII